MYQICPKNYSAVDTRGGQGEERGAQELLPFRVRRGFVLAVPGPSSAGSSTSPASRPAGTPSASTSRRKAGTPGNPRPFSQWRKVLTGTPARRANSARDTPVSWRNARRCPPKLVALPWCPAPDQRAKA